MTTSPGTVLTEADRRTLMRAAALLDQVARRTQRAVVTLHVTAALHCLPGIPPGHATTTGDEQEILRAALRLFANLTTDALRVDGIADAANHALLAYLATR